MFEIRPTLKIIKTVVRFESKVKVTISTMEEERVLSFIYTSSDLYPNIVSLNSQFNWYSMMYFLINFAVFLLVKTCVEFSIFRKLRKEIAEKRMKTEAEILLSQSKNTSG
jgi:hypothetical protein